MKKLKHAFVKVDLESDNYILLDDEYIDAHTKLHYICPQGHHHSMTWNNWQQGKRCPTCDGQSKPTIEFIRKEFAKEGYILLSIEYINSKTKLDYICPEGHEHNIIWANWQQGQRCPCCSGVAKKIIKEIKCYFEKDDYTLASTEYKNNKTKLKYICPKGHAHSIIWSDWAKGVRCPYCSKKAKHKLDDLKDIFKVESAELLSKIYKNVHTKLDYVCPNGHEHSITWASWQQGSRCPKCSNNGTSKFEQEVKDFVLSLNQEIIENDRSIIMGNKGKYLELDILFQCKTKAIECNGIYWHDRPEVKEKDIIKQTVCKELGIELLTITDKEWYENNEIIKNKIRNFLEDY